MEYTPRQQGAANVDLASNAAAMAQLHQALKDYQAWWDQLTPFQRFYYLQKAKYYVDYRKQLPLAVTTAITLAGVLVYGFHIEPTAAFTLLIIGFLAGIVLLLEIERRK